MSKELEKRIAKANEYWLTRDGPKRQKAKDNAWKRGSAFNPMLIKPKKEYGY
jgi:hypothetical protein